MAVGRNNFWALTCCIFLILLNVLSVSAHPSGDSTPDANNKAQLTAKEKQWLADHPTIRILIPDDVAGFSNLNEDGELEGFLVDYLKLIESRAGFKFEMVKHHYQEFVTGKLQKTVDVNIGTQQVDPLDQFQFTNVIFRIPLVIITRDDVPFVSGRHWLAGKRVAVLETFAPRKFLEEDPLGINVVPVASVSVVSVTVSVADSNTPGVQSPETPDGQLVPSAS